MSATAVSITAVAGAGVGLGIALAIRELLPARPALAPALRRLQPPDPATQETRPTSVGGWIAHAVGRWARAPRHDLNILGRTEESYYASKAGYVLFGLAFPPVALLLVAVIGFRLPFFIPPLASVAAAVGMYFMVDADIRYRATKARRMMRFAVCAFVDSVCLERAAGKGPVESLQQAAAIGDGWVYERIRGALLHAELDRKPPWDGLIQVGDDIGVAELGVVGTTMRQAGVEGAAVYDTLRKLAEVMRSAIGSEEETRAVSTTTWLSLPTTMLALVLFALAIYPVLARMMSA